MHRQIDVLGVTRSDAVESGRGNAHDRERHVVDRGRLADRLRRFAEAPLREAVADHGDRGRAGAVVFEADQTSGGGGHAEAAEEPARDIQAVENDALLLDDGGQPVGAVIAKTDEKRGLLLPRVSKARYGKLGLVVPVFGSLSQVPVMLWITSGFDLLCH